MSQPVRILHIVGAMYPGGMENFIMNLYEHIDREQLQFDIAVHMRKENDYGELIESMGGHIYELPRLTSHPFKSLLTLYRLVKTNRYKVVVRHTANALITPQLLVAKMAGAHTICHSHNETDPHRMLHYLGRALMWIAADRCFACSQRAGEWMFGRRSFEVIHNAIDVDKYAYDTVKARSIREELGIGNVRVYGNIANFIASKNHPFLLKIYQEIALRDKDAVFLCVGEGEERSTIEDTIRTLGLEKRVILTGIRKDVERIMSCMDVLIFPSFFEGLPLTLIEAQAAGLPILVSDTVTRDVEVTNGLLHRESLESSPAVWADKAQELAQRPHTRECQAASIAAGGYDIRTLAAWYQDYMLGVGI